jgi:hypothetical protein
MRMIEGCSVSLVGQPWLIERGPTPFQAPLLASGLASRLFDRMPAIASPTIRFAFEVRSLLTFSFELEAPVTERLGHLGASIELRINSDAREPERFDAYESSIELEIWTDDRDPADVSARMQLAPTKMLRVGDPIAPGDRRIAKRGRWELGIDGKPGDMCDLARQLLERVVVAPDAWAGVCSDYSAKLRLVWMVEGLRGGASIDADIVAGLAALRVPLTCYFYNSSC